MSVKSAQYADRFKSVFEQASEAAVGDKQKLQQEVAALNEKRIEIDQQIEALEKQLVEIDDDILVGLKHAAKEAGVRLELGNGKTKEPAKEPGGESKRVTRAELQGAADAVLKALPAKTEEFIAMGEIAAESGVDLKNCRSALKRLKRDKLAKNNGKVGRASGWRKAK